MEEERSLLPAVVAAAVILLLAAALIFWPSDDDGSDTDARADRSSDHSQARAGNEVEGGIRGREIDEATGRPKPRINPALRLPELGTAPAPPDPGPPEFETTEDEIAWYEKRLDAARAQVKNRERFVERLPRARERFEERYPDAATRREAWQQREDTVRDNLEQARARVTELETKLSELRGD